MLDGDPDDHISSTAFEPKLVRSTAPNQQLILAAEELFGCCERLRWSEPGCRLVAHHGLLSLPQRRGVAPLKVHNRSLCRDRSIACSRSSFTGGVIVASIRASARASCLLSVTARRMPLRR